MVLYKKTVLLHGLGADDDSDNDDDDDDFDITFFRHPRECILINLANLINLSN